MALEIVGQAVGGFIAPCAVLLQTTHHNPIQIPTNKMDQLRRLGVAALSHGGLLGGVQGAQAGRGPSGFLFADDAARFPRDS
jgi:hypothetical protein